MAHISRKLIRAVSEVKEGPGAILTCQAAASVSVLGQNITGQSFQFAFVVLSEEKDKKREDQAEGGGAT
jgi:hypothetical protein